jgi:hypothetical protein
VVLTLLMEILGSSNILKSVLRISLLCFSAASLAGSLSEESPALPRRISDEAFRQMISEFSEPEGTSLGGPENFISNETRYADALPVLQKAIHEGGAYLGVGPEQNFSYIAALRPQIAFIIDIRRQNLIEHLMYKALFEISSDRAGFLSHLLSRRRPIAAQTESNVDALFRAYDAVRPDQRLFDENLQLITDRLARHGFHLDAQDASDLEHVYQAFFRYGPQLNYVGISEMPADVRFPDFERLMLQTDGERLNRSFLANESAFRICKEMEERNLVIPVVGDFAGPRAIRALGEYLRHHGTTITTIYASNVEEYLFEQQDNWKKYYSNLSTLPLSSRNVFIRSVSVTNSGVGSSGPGFRTIMMWDRISNVLHAFNAGTISAYPDIIHMSQCGRTSFVQFGCHP